MNKILTYTVAQSKLKAKKYKNKLRTIWGSVDEKIWTPQVQVKFPCSYNVFYVVFYLFLLIPLHWNKNCYAMTAIAINHMCALSE